MGDFEDKHPRDDHGRFTSGLSGFVGKHTGKVKLEGYSKGDKGNLAQWTRSKLQHKASEETTPLDKYIAENHSIDLATLKSSKNENPSTGVLSSGADRHRAHDFVVKEVKRLTGQKEALVKEARKAEVSRVGFANKLSEAKSQAEARDAAHYEERARVGDKLAKNEPLTEAEQNKWRGLNVGFARITSPNAKDPEMASYHDYDPAQDAKESRERAAMERTKAVDAAKKIPALEKKVAAATAKRDDAHVRLGDVLKKFRATSDAEQLARKLNDELGMTWRHSGQSGDFVKDDRSDYKLKVSHDRNGNWEFEVGGATRDPNYPGDKSMIYRVEPGDAPKIKSIDKHKAITFDHGGLNAMFKPETAPKHSMSLFFPTHKDSDESHPLEGEREAPKTKSTNPDAKHPRINEFFNEMPDE